MIQSVIAPEKRLHPSPALSEEPPSPVRNQAISPVLFDTSPGLHSTGSLATKHSALVNHLSRAPVSSQQFLLQMQRAYGNRHVQGIMRQAQRFSPFAPILQRQDDPNQALAMGSLDIHVQDGKRKTPIAGANVHIDQAGVSGPKTIDLTTDRNGDAPSISLDDGDYTVTVTFWCCDPKTFTMHVNGGESNFQFVLMSNCECRVASEDGGQDNNDGSTA